MEYEPMTRILTCALAATLALVACGNDPTESAEQPVTTAPPAAEQAVPAAEAGLAIAAERPDTAADGNDGETVETATVSNSPVVAAIEANTPAPSTAESLRWKEGEHFTAYAVAQPVSTPPGMVEVVEGFWYGCGHCYALEPRLEAWERSKPAWVQLKRLPVIWNEVTREDARLYFTIESLGLVDKLHHEVFRQLHVRGRPITVVSGNRVDGVATEKAAREFLTSHGVSAEAFAKHYRTFSTENKLRQAENMTRRYLLAHTPMIVVHGKYLTDVSMAGGPEPLFQLINDLAARERGAT
jgi:thiol:disulfide interchange protein DsbA